MTDTNNQIQISTSMNMDDFEGVTVHSFEIMTQGEEARLDCIYVDFKPALNGQSEVPGKVVARLNMSTQRLKELQDLLNRHLGSNGDVKEQ